MKKDLDWHHIITLFIHKDKRIRHINQALIPLKQSAPSQNIFITVKVAHLKGDKYIQFFLSMSNNYHINVAPECSLHKSYLIAIFSTGMKIWYSCQVTQE